MIATGQDAEPVVRTQVCVVGSGPAGMTVALELERLGVDCVLLESGGRTPSAEYQALNETPQVGIPTDQTSGNRIRALGGTSAVWGGMCRRLDELDFESRPWIPGSGWPIELKDLLPFYEIGHRILGLPAPEYELSRVDPERGTRVPLEGHDFHNVVFYYNGKPKRFGVEYEPKLTASRRIRTFLDSTVVNVATDALGQSVVAVDVTTLAGKRYRVEAQRFVLAAGTINTARLLLQSDSVHKSGLGNEHDLVGRYFMQHLMWGIPRMFLFDENDLLRVRRTDSAQVSILTGIRPEAARRHQVLNFHFMSQRPPGLENKRKLLRHWADRLLGALEPSSTVAQVEDYLVEKQAALDPGSKRAPCSVEVTVRPEQAPNPHSRITLDDQRDAVGMRRAVMNWRLTELDQESMRRSVRVLGRSLALYGIGRIHMDPTKQLPITGGEELPGGHHQFGTTRMSESPRQGVVDRDCRVHGLSNLYVAGSATFPTTGHANPTLSIVAMAARVAAHVAKPQVAPEVAERPEAQ